MRTLPTKGPISVGAVDRALRNWRMLPSVKRILSSAHPKARTLFEDGLNSVREGNFTEGRKAFVELSKGYPDDKISARANWAIGLSYYREGGRENLRIASDKLSKFAETYQSDKDLQELVQIAAIDVPVIQFELVSSLYDEIDKLRHVAKRDAQIEADLAAGSKEMMQTAVNAMYNLDVFHKKWPKSPYAEDVRVLERRFTDLFWAIMAGQR
jgi:outer membrane protein assembly factor BamD (BamD/ComL family)